MVFLGGGGTKKSVPSYNALLTVVENEFERNVMSHYYRVKIKNGCNYHSICLIYSASEKESVAVLTDDVAFKGYHHLIT